MSISYAHAKDMDGVASTNVDYNNGIMTSRILSPEQNKHEKPGFQNIELSIVHELLHVLLHPIINAKAEGLEFALQEQMIERIAKGFLEI